MNRASKHRAAYVDHVLPTKLPIFQMRGEDREYHATVNYEGATVITVQNRDGTNIKSVVLPESVMIEFGLWSLHAYGEDAG